MSDVLVLMRHGKAKHLVEDDLTSDTDFEQADLARDLTKAGRISLVKTLPNALKLIPCEARVRIWAVVNRRLDFGVCSHFSFRQASRFCGAPPSLRLGLHCGARRFHAQMRLTGADCARAHVRIWAVGNQGVDLGERTLFFMQCDVCFAALPRHRVARITTDVFDSRY